MDQTDRQIIELLKENSRRSNVEIARSLGISEGTVRKRIDRLVDDSTVQLVGLVDPVKVGFRTRAMLFLTVELAQVGYVGRVLCEMPEVLSVRCTTGEYDLVAEGVFFSDEHLMSFLTDRVASIPGVVGSKTAHVPRVLKQEHEWSVPKPPSPRVLVVDDDPDFQETTRVVLEAGGYDTECAGNGDQALRSILCRPPDLVIMDIMMDGVLDGWDATWRIRANPQVRDTPILVVSSITASDYLSMFPTDDDNLIDNFLCKPVSPERLLTEVGRLIKQE